MIHPIRRLLSSPLPLLIALAIACSTAGCSDANAPDNAPDNTQDNAPADPAGRVTAPAAADTSSEGGNVPVAAEDGLASRKKAPQRAARDPRERPVPAFEGTTTAGTRIAMRDLLGKRQLFFFFNPEVDAAAPVGRAVAEVAAAAHDHNFSVLGIGVGSDSSKIARFAREQAFEFPVLDDSSGDVTRKLRLQVPVALLGVDAEGYVTFGLAQFPPGEPAEAYTRDMLVESLRLEEGDTDADGALYAFPDAPELDVVSMEDGSKRTTASLRGKAAIVIFFLHTCPHCHHALEAIEKILDGLPEDKRPELVAISVQNSPSAIRAQLGQLGLDYFTPYLDPGGKAAERWGVTGGVPVVTVVDAEGRIRHRSQGWNEKRDAGMLRMRVAAASGARVPMLLDPTGYTGNDACGVCHEQEYATWQYTKHATAFDTLVTHNADRRTDCVGCHVIGFEQKGGYDFRRRPVHLENVGCESCHGRGGPHLSPGFVPTDDAGEHDYAQVCSTCHNATHSIGFEYETFHPRVSHERIASLSNDERSVLLAGGGPKRDLLPTSADYVGSDACQSCHAKEYETWAASPHGHAVETLEKQGKADDAECLACHTTAYGKPGGFPEGAPVSAHADLARVGCESCHGPGGDHIGPDAKRVGTIVSLGDKCDSCSILKICGTCHDDANDPGFEFEVEQRIEDQRHGTIESAATRAGLSALHRHPGLPGPGLDAAELAAIHGPESDRALLRHAFEQSPARAPVDGSAAPQGPADDRS